MLKGITILFLLLNTLMGLGQSNPRDEFNEAKRLMSNQQLRSAMSAFEVLKTDPQLGVYAYFLKVCVTVRTQIITGPLTIGR